ncbi:hypothetical protein OF83DRAFT_1081534 [Amylostereum chailletii]|nr:hypothetical protein OF83DRAFT_1081534 [Amylostereum chailletii]
MTTFFFFLPVLSIAFLPPLESKAVFGKWDALVKYFPSPVALILVLALVSRVAVLEQQMVEALDQAVLSARSRFIADTFDSIRSSRSGKAFNDIQAAKIWFENRAVAQNTVIKHLHTRLHKATACRFQLEEALALSRTHTALATGEAAAFKASNIALRDRLDKLEHKHSHLEGENAVAFKILGVASYPEFIARDIERTAQCDNLQERNVHTQQEREMIRARLGVVLDQKTKLRDRFAAVKDANRAMKMTLFENLQQRHALEATLGELMADKGRLKTFVQGLKIEQTNLQSALAHLTNELRTLSSQKRASQTAIANLTTKNENLKFAAAGLAKERTPLKSSLADLQDENTGLITEKEALNIMSARLKTEREELRATIENLTKDRFSAQEKLTEERHQVATAHEHLNKALDTSKTRITELTQKNNNLRIVADELVRDQVYLQASFSGIEKEHDTLLAIHRRTTLEKGKLEITLTDVIMERNRLAVALQDRANDKVNLPMSIAKSITEHEEPRIAHKHSTIAHDIVKKRAGQPSYFTTIEQTHDPLAFSRGRLDVVAKEELDLTEADITIERNEVKLPVTVEELSENGLCLQHGVATEGNRILAHLEEVPTIVGFAALTNKAKLAEETSQGKEFKDEPTEMPYGHIDHLMSAQEQCSLESNDPNIPEAPFPTLPTPPLTPDMALQQYRGC